MEILSKDPGKIMTLRLRLQRAAVPGILGVILTLVDIQFAKNDSDGYAVFVGLGLVSGVVCIGVAIALLFHKHEKFYFANAEGGGLWLSPGQAVLVASTLAIVLAALIGFVSAIPKIISIVPGVLLAAIYILLGAAKSGYEAMVHMPIALAIIVAGLIVAIAISLKAQK